MRLITSADLDGVVCAAIILDVEDVSEVIFAHPRDIEENLVEVQPGDIIASLPYHSNASLWFDQSRDLDQEVIFPKDIPGKIGKAPSIARLVFEYYQSEKLKKYQEVLSETDRLDSADLTFEDVLNPYGWILLGFLLDPRTGFSDYRETSLTVIDAIRAGNTIDEILASPAVKGHIKQYYRDEVEFKKVLMRCTICEKNVSITDFRGVERIPIGNRFIIFTFFPNCNVNIRLFRAENPALVVISAGKSLFYGHHPMNLGKLMKEFEGGGQEGAGACQVEKERADQVLRKIVDRLKI